MKLTLKVWRQKNQNEKGAFITYPVVDVNPHMSFLEMLDVLNDDLTDKNEEPIAFEHDCREGICGSCGFFVNGRAHGPLAGTTVCQLHMRHFNDDETVIIEPWRAHAFPVVKDLIVDRSGFDRILQSGGYTSANTGAAPDANAIPISKESSDQAFLAAQCIGCGACVASCKNASASLFVSAKISHLSLLPQGLIESQQRVTDMVTAVEKEKFGSCTNTGACEAECPKEISIENIARMNRELFKARIAS